VAGLRPVWHRLRPLCFISAGFEPAPAPPGLRARRFDANAGFPITPTLLDAYLTAFEEPMDEGEQVITVATADEH
jgi:hypothetical protein